MPTTHEVDINLINIQTRVRYAETPESEVALEQLTESIKRYGLLQPILIGPNNLLVAGWRRYTACQRLGFTTIPCYRRDTLSEAEYFELEREENFQRLDFTWQQEVEEACRIHDVRAREAILKGGKWTRQMTGDLIGYSDAYVDNCFRLRPALLAKDKEVCEADGVTDALRVVLRRVEDKAVQEKARRSSLQSGVVLPALAALLGGPRITVNPETGEKCVACGGTGKNSKESPCYICLDCTAEDHIARKLRISEKLKGRIATSPVPVTPEVEKGLLETLLAEELSEADKVEQVIDLSHTLFRGDSAREILPQWPPDCVDHVITDMPYAVDVTSLQQAGDALMDVSRIESTHQVDENLNLYTAMFPAVFRVLKPGGFFITWCDIMNWQYLYDLALLTNFKVQRWPITWHKTSLCKCQMANVLFTKNTEIALVCRKGNATLPAPVGTCVVTAPNDAAKVSNPFAKPFAVWEFLIDSVTIQGQTILDPCAGEGSGTVAALKMNRKVLAIEKDEVHFPYLIENVKAHWQGVFKKVRFV